MTADLSSWRGFLRLFYVWHLTKLLQAFKSQPVQNWPPQIKEEVVFVFLLMTSNVHLKICKKKKRKSQEEFQLSLENRPNCTCRISSVCVCMLVQKSYSKAIIFINYELKLLVSINETSSCGEPPPPPPLLVFLFKMWYIFLAILQSFILFLQGKANAELQSPQSLCHPCYHSILVVRDTVTACQPVLTVYIDTEAAFQNVRTQYLEQPACRLESDLPETV